MRKIIIILFVFVFSFNFLSQDIYANSAQKYWSGSKGTTILVAEENSPIIVTQEDLIFNIYDFPINHYDFNGSQNYEANFKAIYQFKNTADYDVSAKLYFPLGHLPSYLGSDNYLNSPEVFNNYKISVNGEEVDSNIRYTHSPRFVEFNITKDINLINDDYIESFFKEDTKVKEIIYQVSEYDKEKYPAADAAISFKLDENKNRVLLENQSGFDLREEKGILTTWVDKEAFSLFIFGEDLDELPNFEVYKDGSRKEKIDVNIDVVDIKEYSFKEFIEAQYGNRASISFVDYYNAKVNLYDQMSVNGFILNENLSEFEKDLMPWFEYEIQIGANESISNEVCASLYPDINEHYVPAIYNYHYLLSPASTWKEFNNLNIQINTDKYLNTSSLELVKNENGYSYSSQELPDTELEFSLSDSENPQVESGPYNYFYGIIAMIVIVFIAIIFIIKHKKKNK